MRQAVTILFFLVVLMLGVIYLQRTLFSKQVKPKTARPAVTRQIDGEADAKVTALKFYQVYDNCLRNPPVEAEGRVSDYCQEQNPFAGASLAANLQAGGVATFGADPVFCAQNSPSKYQVMRVKTLDGEIKVFIKEIFGTLSQTLDVLLMKEKGSWKVIKITCPHQ